MDYRDDDALDSIFPPYLVWFRYSLTFISYQNTPPLLPSHLYLVFNPPISFHHDMHINLFCFQTITGCRPITSSLVKLSCAFWILNLTSSMMTRLNILLIFCDVFHLIVSCHDITWCIFILRALVSFVFVHHLVLFW